MAITDLIERAKSGELAATEELLSMLRPRLRNYARGILGESLAARIDTSDLVQSSLAQVFQGLPSFRGITENEWMAWVRKIMTTEACRLRRHHYAAKRSSLRDRHRGVAESNRGSESPREKMIAAEDQQRVVMALAQLPEQMQEIIRRRVFLRESFHDIAYDLGKSAAAVRVTWTRAIKRVATQLKEPSSVALETSSVA